jgi:hypothetical protein
MNVIVITEIERRFSKYFIDWDRALSAWEQSHSLELNKWLTCSSCFNAMIFNSVESSLWLPVEAISNVV